MATLDVPKRDDDELSTYSSQSQASELIQGMGFHKSTTINASQQTERVDSFKKKKKRTLNRKQQENVPSGGGCFGWCLSGPPREEEEYASREKRLQYGSTSHPNMAIRGVTVREKHEEWFFLLSDKLNQIYKDNTDCQPEW
eukprot:CAMPEP_0170495960 /NCGR_PEP_ID=MMETSP0208-20121228/19494_1 /TAXON_ID=197538 /ORGANISM="Strombidium inclinatum, Strain S3" /LENGTH=140 /DNA_ID=CAMNT_0010772377 /DNA_START=607 /DNA_END=1026 /DNA_ORIENTATION=+